MIALLRGAFQGLLFLVAVATLLLALIDLFG